MYNLETFTKADMCRCAVTLRNMDESVKSMEETSDRIVRYIYDNFVEQRTGERACALVRFFKTHRYGQLNVEAQTAARAILNGQSIDPATKCLTLLATAGDKPQWNSKYGSTGHQAIPLVDKDFVDRVPMIQQLIQQFGLEVSTVIRRVPTLITDAPHKAFNVFYIPQAVGSPYIPAQQEFVIPHKVQSVLGFGGMLPSGDLFAIIMFSKVPIPLDTANRFKWLSAYVRIAVEAYGRETTFAKDRELINQ
jgi:hypothetical protein